MAAHGIYFDFQYQPKLCQIGQNNSAAAAEACLARRRQKFKGGKSTIRVANVVTVHDFLT